MSGTSEAAATSTAQPEKAPAPAEAPRFSPPPPIGPGERLRVAVLVSGSGTTLQNFLNERERGRLSLDLAAVLSSRDDAYALKRARNAGVPVEVIERKAFPDRAAFSAGVLERAAAAGAALVCMAGYLERLVLPPGWLGRVVNIHPSLLPAFGGKGMFGDAVHAAVLEYGCRITGCTVHVADNAYDHGPVVLQRAVPVLAGDTVATLRARVFHEECLAYPQALRLFAEGRIAFEGRRVQILPPPPPRP